LKPVEQNIVLRYNEIVTDYQSLADFRYHIRRFLHFSEEAARLSGIEPQQHQLLLAAKGFQGNAAEGPTIGYLADRLQVRHHTAVELVDRMVAHGLVARGHNQRDRRQVIVSLTSYGDRILRKLSADHVHELRESGPALVAVLESIVGVPAAR
jgi:DNA-binding MarR family transcriptional regulator